MSKTECYKVGAVSAKLTQLLKKLEKCEAEKQEILKWIDELTKNGKLEENAKLVEKRLDESLSKFEKVQHEIENLKKQA